MAKIVYNSCYGGFSLSSEAVQLYMSLKGIDNKPYMKEIDRDDPVLVRVVEELGEAASGSLANLAIKELPSGTLYIIHEYDGWETVMTPTDFRWLVARD